MRPNQVAEATEDELTTEGSDESNGGGRGVNSEREATLVVDPADHLGHHANDLEIVGIGEETHTGDDDGLDVEPRELGIIKRVEDGEAGLEMVSHDRTSWCTRRLSDNALSTAQTDSLLLCE